MNDRTTLAVVRRIRASTAATIAHIAAGDHPASDETAAATQAAAIELVGLHPDSFDAIGAERSATIAVERQDWPNERSHYTTEAALLAERCLPPTPSDPSTNMTPATTTTGETTP